MYTWPGRSVRGHHARGQVLPLFSPPSHTTIHRNIVSLIVTVLLLHCYIAELCHTQRTAIHSAHVTCSICHTAPLCHVYHSTTYIAHMWHVASCHTPCHTYHSATPSAHVTCSLMPHATRLHCAHTVSCTHCVMRRCTYAHQTHTHATYNTVSHLLQCHTVLHPTLYTCIHANTVSHSSHCVPHGYMYTCWHCLDSRGLLPSWLMWQGCQGTAKYHTCSFSSHLPALCTLDIYIIYYITHILYTIYFELEYCL